MNVSSGFTCWKLSQFDVEFWNLSWELGGKYFVEGGAFIILIGFPLLVEVEVVDSLGVAAFFVPVADESFGFELGVEIGC